MNKGHLMSHKFGMFLSVNHSIEHTYKYIRSVKYYLPPKYATNNQVRIRNFLFEYFWETWEEFEVGIEIEFNIINKIG